MRVCDRYILYMSVVTVALLLLFVFRYACVLSQYSINILSEYAAKSIEIASSILGLKCNIFSRLRRDQDRLAAGEALTS